MSGLLGPTAQATPQSDDFSGGAIDPAVWTLQDPLGQALVNQATGLLTIQVPGGPDHHPGTEANTAIRLLQDHADTNLSLEARFETLPSEPGHFQGLVAAADDRHQILWLILAGANGPRLGAYLYQDGYLLPLVETERDPSSTIHLRLVREGDTWSLFDSYDGYLWEWRGDVDHSIALTGVGLCAGNRAHENETTDRDRDDPLDPGLKAADQPATPLAVEVDYFFDAANPPSTEDGQPFRTGSRSYDGLEAYYLFGAGSGGTVFDVAPGSDPLHLDFSDTTGVRWVDGGGLALDQASIALTSYPADRITDACRTAGEVTFEAWLEPATTGQSGPARILTLSGDGATRNATLAHGLWGSLPSDVFDTRLRTTATSDNGQPDTWTPAGSLTGALQHVAMTFDPSGWARIYVDGVEATAQDVGGTLANWQDGFPLAIGAEVDGSRPWLGTFRLAAIYSRALGPDEVANHFLAGPTGGDLHGLAPAVTLVGLEGAPFTLDQPVPLEASAFDPGGTVVSVDFLVDGQLLASDTTPPFRYDWTDPLVGSHLVQARAYDDEGNVGDSSVVPLQVTAPLDYFNANFQSDDFSGFTLDPFWTVEDPTGGAELNESQGNHLVEWTGSGTDPWDFSGPSAFVRQAESDVDFGLELKLSTDEFTGSGFCGLRVVDAAGDGIQIIGRKSNEIWTIEWSNGAAPPTEPFHYLQVTPPGDGLWLRLLRQGDTWVFLHSLDGLHFTRDADTLFPLVVDRSGWIAGAQPGSTLATVAVDYAFNLASPINNEDGDGDQDPPEVEDLEILPELSRVTIRWATDEPAYSTLSYGKTTGLELGAISSGTFTEDHLVEIEGLDPFTAYHFRITGVDTVGNAQTTPDHVFWTDLVAVEAAGPTAGDVYREVFLVMTDSGNQWRVTDPEATHTDAGAFLPNPVMSLSLPDLTGAVRAELVLDRWGGHPGTSNKRVRFNDGSWLRLPEPPIPDSSPECYTYQDNPVIELPLNQIQAGSNTFEGTSGPQVCENFGWGQWGMYGAIVRIYYPGATGHPTGSITQPTAGDSIIDAVQIDVDASGPAGVGEVVILARYDGYDADGDGVRNEWHRTYRRDRGGSELRLLDVVRQDTTAPYGTNWDVTWVPDQAPGSVDLQARIRGADGLWYVADHVTGLSLSHTGGPVHSYISEDVPRVFWVRTDDTESATFTIPAEHDLGLAGSARMVTFSWNGSDQGVIDVNGTWQADDFGADHFWQRDALTMPVGTLLSGVNTMTISAATDHHGLELLWPGPIFQVRYDGGTGAVFTATDPILSWGELRATDQGLMIPLVIEAAGHLGLSLAIHGDRPDLVRGLASRPDKAALLDWSLSNDRLTVRGSAAGLAAEPLGILLRPDPSGPRSLYATATLADGRVIDLAPATVPPVPDRFELQPNRPNPFNPMTRIGFALPVASRVRLGVYDLQGRLVRLLVDEPMTFGVHHVDWDGRDGSGRGVSSGTYLYRMQADGFADTGKMLLVR